MNTTKTLAAVIGGLMLTGAAQAQAPALEGKAVLGQGGVVLGHVERVIYRDNGTPAQVLVRPAGPRMAAGPRSLSYSALRPSGDSLTAPLTQAEFNAMPAVNVQPK